MLEVINFGLVPRNEDLLLEELSPIGMIIVLCFAIKKKMKVVINLAFFADLCLCLSNQE